LSGTITAGELGERLDVAPEPGLRALVEDQPRDHVPGPAEHHDEHPRLARSVRGRVDEHADVAEVDLGDVTAGGLDGDRHVVGRRPALTLDPRARALDRRQAAREVDVLEAELVVDRRRRAALVDEPLDGLGPGRQRRLLLRHRPRRQFLEDGSAQLLERWQRVDVAGERARLGQRRPVLALGVRAHPKQARHLARTRTHPVQAHQFLKSMHVYPFHRPDLRRTGVRISTSRVYGPRRDPPRRRWCGPRLLVCAGRAAQTPIRPQAPRSGLPSWPR
jgi:hypothetical protein